MSAKTTVDAKIPPQNVDAEKSLIGAILIDEGVLADVVEVVRYDDFYDKRHSAIFKSIVTLFEKNKPVDILTLTDDLKKHKKLEEIGGTTYLAELTNYVPTSANAAAYGEMVAHAAARRRLIKAGTDIVESGYDTEEDVKAIIENAEATLFGVSDRGDRNDLTSLSDILLDSFDRLAELHKNKGQIRGKKTGYRDLDNMTAGLQKSDLIILAARPAMGKTTLVTNLAYNVATLNREAVLFFSLEMSKEQLTDRMLSDVAQVDSWSIRTGNLSDEDFERLSEASSEMSEAPIYIDDTAGTTVLDIRTKARRIDHQQKVGLIVIDYLQLIEPSGGSKGNRVQEISEISRGLKLLARELNVPVIALSQLSRTVEQRTPQVPMLSDLRESGSIEQDADIVMFIYREAYYNPETERQNITDLILAKHRNGPVGRVELYFHPERLRFLSLDKHAE